MSVKNMDLIRIFPPGSMTVTTAGAILTAIALMFTVVAGCASSPDHQDSAGVLSITQMSTAIGGDGPDQQRLSYSITIVNWSSNQIAVRTLQPLLSDQFAWRSPMSDTAVTVGKTLRPRESITVTGEVSFDAKGVSKEEIVGWGPAILGARAVSEQDIKAPWTK